MHPVKHGVGLQGSHCGYVDESIKTIPGRLSEVGYQTHGISTNPYAGPATGIDEKFDDFEHLSFDNLLSKKYAFTLAKYVMNLWGNTPEISTDRQKFSTPYLVNDLAKKRIKSFKQTEEPFFMYLHYNEPHRPYYPPRKFTRKYTDEISFGWQEALKFAEKMHKNAYRDMADGTPYTSAEWEALLAMYDAEIAYTDYHIGSLFNKIEEMDNTIMVVTSDHGEFFGEYDLLDHHIFLHDALTHVPLVTYGLDMPQEDSIVQHSDVMKTILNIAGANHHQIDGVDLMHQSREFAISQDVRGSVIDRDEEAYQRFLNHNPEFDTSSLPKSLLTAVRSKNLKYTSTDEWERVYELPDENTNIIDKGSIEVEKFRRQLDELPKRKKSTSSGSYSADLRDQLSDLGYM